MGLHNLFIRRLNYLVKDTQLTLKEMTEPLIQLVKDEVEAQKKKPR